MGRISELRDLIIKKNDPELNAYLDILIDPESETNLKLTEFAGLKEILHSNEWPPAVDPTLICDPNSEEDKINRAEGILELLIEENLKGKKFLDFGCGEGHIPLKAIDQNTTLSVGYDINEDPHWNEFRNKGVTLTNDMKVVESQAPYDVILIYDVIDHATLEEVKQIMVKVKSLLSNKGTVYLRAHPFCSRHATHLYHKLNKAYVHLVFTEEELAEMGYESPVNAKILFPISQYEKIFKEAGLKVQSSNVLRERIEDTPFKKNTLVKNRIKQHFPNVKDYPSFQCEQQFLDYILK